MLYTPKYRLTLYAPKTVANPDETAVLVPRAGSAHADPFVVTTADGVAGARPYLDFPSARQASIDPVSKKRTIGSITVRILDARTADGDNLERWVTAFLGDARGANQLGGAKARVESWDEAVGAWVPWFTGRVSSAQLHGAQWFELGVKDRSADLNVAVFVGAPHTAAAAYAHRAQLLPLGLLEPYGDFAVTTPIKGVVEAHDAGRRGFVIRVNRGEGDQRRLIATQRLATLDEVEGGLRAKVTPSAAAGTWRANCVLFGSLRPEVIFCYGDAENAATPLPPIGTAVECVIYDPTTEISAEVPLVVRDVHPVTYLRLLAAGYFGRLRDDGAVRWSIPIDGRPPETNSFALLEADATFAPHRAIVTKASTLAVEFEAVCREHNLAYDFNAAGELELIDLRRRMGAIATTLTDADRVLEAGLPKWAYDEDASLPVVSASYVAERRIRDDELPALPGRQGQTAYPAIPPIRIETTEAVAAVVVHQGAAAAGTKPREERIVARGLRFRASEPGAHPFFGHEMRDGRRREEVLRRYLETLVTDVQAPFARGAAYLDVVGRLSSANVALVRVGSYVVLDVDVVPDPATNLRGGPRLGLCVSRSQDRLQVKLRFLDAGESAVAVAPVVATPTLPAGEANAIDVGVALNVAGNPARVDVAITSAAVGVRPAEADPAWVRAGGLEATGTLRVPNLPAQRRAWVRARSEPQAGDRLMIASGWVHPAGAGYVDLTAIAPPSALVVVSDSCDETALSWANGVANLPVEVLLAEGGAPATWELAHRVAVLPPGSIRYPLGLNRPLVAGAAYTVAVRHVDDHGGTSAVDAEAFVAGADGVLSPPAFEVGFTGSISQKGMPAMDGTFGLAVVGIVRPGFVEFEVAVETAPGSGAYGAYALLDRQAAVQGAWTIGAGVAPNDGLRRRLRARSTRDGAIASAYTDEITVTPWTARALPAFPSTPICRVRRLEPAPASDAPTLVRVQVDYIDPTGDAGQVKLKTLSANAAVNSGPAVGTAVASGEIWKLERPARGLGQGEAVFEGTGQSGKVETTFPLFEQGVIPRLEVKAIPGSSSYTIAWAGLGVELSIDGAAYAVPPASPFVVSRNPAGGAFKELTFRSTVGADWITNSVNVPPIDADTVTPSLEVVAGASTATAQPFTVYAEHPVTGEGLTAEVTLARCTAVIGGVVYGPDVTVVVASGTLITVNRPAFNSPPASVRFLCVLAGGGKEDIARAIHNQDKTSFGPSLDLDVTPGTTSYAIGYAATGAVEYRIDAGAWATPPSNPFTVSRNAPGGADKVVQLRATLDDQTVPATVTVPAQPAVGGGGSDPAPFAKRLYLRIHSEALDQLEALFTVGGTYDHWHVVWRRQGTVDTWTEVAAFNAYFDIGPPTDIDSAYSRVVVIEAFIEFHASHAGGANTVLGVSATVTLPVPAGPDY